MTTHTGKIGRLSKKLRDELGQRIEDGQPGTEIVHWLNALPEVQDTLKAHFQDRPISEQNLSDWKQAGHLAWLRREEMRRVAENLTEQSEELDIASDGIDIGDRFAVVLAAEMTRLATQLLQEEEDPKKKWEILCKVRHELSQLRRDDHRAERVSIKREQWERELERQAEEARKDRKDRLREQLMDGLMTDKNDRLSQVMHRIRFDLPYQDLLKSKPPRTQTSPGKRPGQNPRKSPKIQPNKT